MRKLSFILIAVILLFCNTFAQTSKPKTSAKQTVPKPDLTEKRLRAHVEYLASDKLKGEKNTIQKAGYVAGILANYRLQGGVLKKFEGKKITQSRSFLQEFLINQNGVSSENYNVVGILEGTDAVLKNEAIIIAANYTNEKNNDFSGVAMLLELARIFTKERTNKRTLIFVAFGANQSGATVYLNDPIFPLEKTVAMFELDNIGNLRENKLNVGGIGTADELKTIVGNLNVIDKSTESLVVANKILENDSDETIKNKLEENLKMSTLTSVRVEVKNGIVWLFGMVSRQSEAKLAEKLALDSKAKDVTNNIMIKPLIIYPFYFSLNLSKESFVSSDNSLFYAKKIPGLNFSTDQTSAPINELNFEGLKRITDLIAEIVKAVDANEKRPTFNGKN